MPGLPWPVTYGNAVWVLTILCGIALGVLAGRRLGRVLERRRVAWVRALAASVGESETTLVDAGMAPRAHPLRWVVVGGGAGGLLLLAVLGLVGQLALQAYDSQLQGNYVPNACVPPPRPLEPLSLSLAASSPFHRAAALAALEDGLRRVAAQCPHADDLLDRLREVADLRGSCVADVLAAHGLYERAAEAGEACGGSPALTEAAAAWMALGRFDRASRTVERAGVGPYAQNADFVVGVHLLAGRADAAARAARALVARQRALRPPVASPAVTDTLECLAEALEARGGSAGALADLRRSRDGAAAKPCLLLLADVLKANERVGVLLPLLFQEQTRSPWAELAWYLAREFDERPDLPAIPLEACGSPFEDWSPGPVRRFALYAIRRGLLERIERIEPPASGLPSDVRRSLAVVGGRLATAEIGFGDLDRARGLLARATEEFAMLAADPLARGAGLDDPAAQAWRSAVLRQTLVELHSGDFAEARRDLQRVPAGEPEAADLSVVLDVLETGSAPALAGARPAGSRFTSSEWDAWAAVARDDGVALAGLVRRDPLLRRVVLLGGSRTTNGREVLLAWFREHPGGDCCWRCSVLRPLECAWEQRALAEAVGDRATADRLTATLGAYREALRNRAAAVPLEVLEQLPLIAATDRSAWR